MFSHEQEHRKQKTLVADLSVGKWRVARNGERPAADLALAAPLAAGLDDIMTIDDAATWTNLLGLAAPTKFCQLQPCLFLREAADLHQIQRGRSRFVPELCCHVFGNDRRELSRQPYILDGNRTAPNYFPLTRRVLTVSGNPAIYGRSEPRTREKHLDTYLAKQPGSGMASSPSQSIMAPVGFCLCAGRECSEEDFGLALVAMRVIAPITGNTCVEDT